MDQDENIIFRGWLFSESHKMVIFGDHERQSGEGQNVKNKNIFLKNTLSD